ncbi:phage integrase N-terminal SAM-like domain-containing protein [Marinobacter sp. S0848L]|uniref:site-specific integrase n=1 Tax=Marinobacter sp. S0848L TaxID=2926423 RepID=UPI001FF235F9|nr:phage integrase N-terminal SAM-like domain-containing protein [Marinobacter sp. S0848L]MCK0105750.1 phage integrase N-terminal SAM-like domain-containing protein [Marinobacter sp. S0848L]
MDITGALEQSRPGLVNLVQAAIHKRELNQRAEQTYLHWISRYVLFHDLKDPGTLSDDDQAHFFAYLNEQLRVSRARLNQARQALEFFYDDVLSKPEQQDSAAA